MYYGTIRYNDQCEFDYFLATSFNKYDRNRDCVIDYTEF